MAQTGFLWSRIICKKKKSLSWGHAIKVMQLWMAAHRLHDLSPLWYFLHLKRGIWWLWWIIWLIQSIFDEVCHQRTLQTSKDHRSMREVGTLLLKKLHELLFYLFIFYHFHVKFVGNFHEFTSHIPKKNRLQKTMTKESKVIFSPIYQSFIWSYAILRLVLTSHNWKPSI